MKKTTKNTETHFRFSVRLASALGNSRDFTEEDADPNAALARLAKSLANSGLSSPSVHEAKVTILASRKFIATFRPMDDVHPVLARPKRRNMSATPTP